MRMDPPFVPNSRMTEIDRRADVLDPRLVAQFRATLNGLLYALDDADAPLGAHWCLFPPLATTAALTADGHAPRAHPVSEAEFPRRMWVGGALELGAPFRIGESVERVSRLDPVIYKDGRGGRFALTGATHDYRAADRALCRERQEIAFRGSSTAPVAGSADRSQKPAGDLIWEVATPPTLLFRYSALTFNTHRIHYDADYARQVEGYADILVQGPLQATLLLNLAATLLDGPPARFDYRATSPLLAHDGAIVAGAVAGGRVRCSVHAADGRETMRASAER